MTENVKRLLDEATPLPWRVFDGGDAAHPGIDSVDPISTIVVYGTEDEDYGINQPEDAALIVHAVNHLPDYEAAVDALESLLLCVREYTRDELLAMGMKRTSNCILNAESALRRLRGES